MKINRSMLKYVSLRACYLTTKGRNKMFDVMFLDEWEQAFSILEGLDENILNNQREIVRTLESYEYFVQAEHIAKMKRDEFRDFVQANLMYF